MPTTLLLARPDLKTQWHLCISHIDIQAGKKCLKDNKCTGSKPAQTSNIFHKQRRQQLFKVGGQVAIQVVMRRGATAIGAFYSAKEWGGGNCPPCPPFTDAPDKNLPPGIFSIMTLHGTCEQRVSSCARNNISNFAALILQQYIKSDQYILALLRINMHHTYTANVHRQTTDKLMFKSVVSTVR